MGAVDQVGAPIGRLVTQSRADFGNAILHALRRQTGTAIESQQAGTGGGDGHRGRGDTPGHLTHHIGKAASMGFLKPAIPQPLWIERRQGSNRLQSAPDKDRGVGGSTQMSIPVFDDVKRISNLLNFFRDEGLVITNQR